MNRRCPVCRRAVFRTSIRSKIGRHTDTLGAEVCPMSGELYCLTEDGEPAGLWRLTRWGFVRAAA